MFFRWKRSVTATLERIERALEVLTMTAQEMRDELAAINQKTNEIAAAQAQDGNLQAEIAADIDDLLARPGGDQIPADVAESLRAHSATLTTLSVTAQERSAALQAIAAKHPAP